MKKILSFFLAAGITCSLSAQTEDVKSLNATARNFMIAGDYNNAIIVLNRALQIDKNNLDLQKDLVQTYYLKQDFDKAYEGVKVLVERENADVMTFQIAGNVYKALEEVKECDKMYKKALKKFPKSGALLSEYGELLWATKDFSAIDLWEEGIRVDPAYGGNYYNAARYYFYTKDKVWSLIYGEIFVNMESLSERGAAMKQLLFEGYKEKLFAEPDLLKGSENIKSAFAKAYLISMNKQSALTNKGINIEVLTMIRTRFILDWFVTSAPRYPFRLFDYQQQLIREGMFEAYNQWLFGPIENLAAYDNWTKTHSEQFSAFTTFQRSRVFKVPAGQYYQIL